MVTLHVLVKPFQLVMVRRDPMVPLGEAKGRPGPTSLIVAPSLERDGYTFGELLVGNLRSIAGRRMQLL